MSNRHEEARVAVNEGGERPEAGEGEDSPSQLIDARINELPDWRARRSLASECPLKKSTPTSSTKLNSPVCQPRKPNIRDDPREDATFNAVQPPFRTEHALFGPCSASRFFGEKLNAFRALQEPSQIEHRPPTRLRQEIRPRRQLCGVSALASIAAWISALPSSLSHSAGPFMWAIWQPSRPTMSVTGRPSARPRPFRLSKISVLRSV
jgi:hypothetical protein